MLFTGIVYIGVFILGIVTAVFPVSSGFSNDFILAFDTLGGYVALVNTLLPVDTLATALAILIGVELIVFSFKSFKWVVSHVPFVGGRG